MTFRVGAFDPFMRKALDLAWAITPAEGSTPVSMEEQTPSASAIARRGNLTPMLHLVTERLERTPRFIADVNGIALQPANADGEDDSASDFSATTDDDRERLDEINAIIREVDRDFDQLNEDTRKFERDLFDISGDSVPTELPGAMAPMWDIIRARFAKANDRIEQCEDTLLMVRESVNSLQTYFALLLDELDEDHDEDWGRFEEGEKQQVQSQITKYMCSIQENENMIQGARFRRQQHLLWDRDCRQQLNMS